MLERGEIEIGAELAVDAGEQIEIELRGDAVGVVIGAIEDVGRLDEIDADDEQLRRRRGSRAGAAQKLPPPRAARNCRWSSPGKKPARGIAATATGGSVIMVKSAATG